MSIQSDRVVAHRHGRRPRARGARDTRCRSLPRAASRTRCSFLVLTNNSIYTPRDLAARLRRNGLHVQEEAIWTSALATANLLESQRPGGSAFVIGEAGLTTALHEVGYTLTDKIETMSSSGRRGVTASSGLRMRFALFWTAPASSRPIRTPTGPAPEGPLPATGSAGGVDQPRHGCRPVLRWEAKPADDAVCA